MPSQCLLVGMQVPFGHWKPLHFFSEIQNWVDVAWGFLKLPLFSYKKPVAFSLCPPAFAAGMGIVPLSLLQAYLSKFVEIPPTPWQSPHLARHALPQLAGSSSEPSWQSASPSQAQRCGMQWPFWHWKLEASQV